MINYSFLCVITLFCLSSYDPATPTLDGTDGLAYIEMAEDILASGKSERGIAFARKCYVLSAIVDPELKRSAILGLIEIDNNEQRSAQLLASLPSGKLLLGEVVVRVDAVRPIATPKAVISACKEVQNLRILDKIQLTERDDKRIELLRFASLSLPSTLRKVLLEGGKVSRNKQVVSDSLKAELKLLGGTTQWSAAVLVEGNVPLNVLGTVDLAALMVIDASTSIFENVKWRTP